MALREPGRHWERLGFRADPYYAPHLPVAPLSLELFTGREADRTRLREFLLAYPTGMTMVQGPPGVGKTSLVNVGQQELFAAARRFPLFDVVETTEDTTRESFLLSVLSGAVSSLTAAYGEDALQGDAAFQQARAAVTRTLQYATSMNLSAGVPKLGSAGVSRGPVATPPLAPTAQSLLDLLRGLVAGAEARGFDGLLVPVNNLDTLTEDAVVLFLNLVRDVCTAVEGVHWVFVGGAYLFEALETRARRVSEWFTSNPIALEPLGWPDVRTALEADTALRILLDGLGVDRVNTHAALLRALTAFRLGTGDGGRTPPAHAVLDWTRVDGTSAEALARVGVAPDRAALVSGAVSELVLNVLTHAGAARATAVVLLHRRRRPRVVESGVAGGRMRIATNLLQQSPWRSVTSCPLRTRSAKRGARAVASRSGNWRRTADSSRANRAANVSTVAAAACG